MKNSAIKTVTVIIFATMFSKVLGLFRDILLASYYGASPENAAFLAALRIPLSFFDLIFGAAILGVFIPVYNSIRKTTDSGGADEFANIFITTVVLVTGILSFFGIVFSEQIVMLITSGYDSEKLKLTSDLLKILFPMIIFIGSTYILTGILQSKDRFLLPALVSSVSNLGVIFYFLFLNKYFGIYGLSAAYLAAWAIQVLTLTLPLKKLKYKFKFKLDFKNPELIKAIKTTIPIMAGSWLVPVGFLAGNNYASKTTENDIAVTSFYFSTVVFLLISGILTHGICNYIFPKLSQNASEENKAEFLNIVKNGLSAAFFIIMPVSCIAYILRNEAIVILFMRKEFTADIARVTAGMLAALVPAMIMFSVIEILNRVYYAKKLVKVPMVASLCGIALNIILCEIFIVRFKLPPFYIAVSSFCSQTLAALILLIALGKKVAGVLSKDFFVNFIKIIISAAILFGSTQFIYKKINNDVFNAGLFQNIYIAALIAAAGIIIYLAVNFALKTELLSFLRKNKKLKNKKE